MAPKNYYDFYQRSIKDPVNFWQEQAALIHWFEPPKEILSKDEDDLYRWYKGGKLNTAYLALDYHVENGKGDQQALIYDSPVTGQQKTYTYSQLLHEVEMVAGMLKQLGVNKGDRVIIYMPMIPETAFAMLACARIGAIHSVVFGGFAAHELAVRIDDAQPKVLLTASGGKEIDKIIPYKPVVDNAIEKAEYKVEKVVVLQREFAKADMQTGRDIDWIELHQASQPETYVIVDANDPLYILYTSGTTGKPKGVIRENGGHAVAMKYSMKYVYGASEEDVYWAGSDYGWVVGHSYIVYGPLIHGCTTILFEGKPIGTPDAGAFWRIIDEYKVNIFFTAPTAFRAIRKVDPNAELFKKYDISSLKRQFLAGERCDVSTLEWLQDLLKVPVIDHWWQTESGSPMIAQMTGIEMYAVKPGSSGKAVAGYEFDILDESGNPLGPNEEGALVIKYPLPPGALPNLWQDTDRFKASYLAPFPGYYFSGDGAYIDEEGYIFITGRIDDVINVAGHRLSTSDFEEIVASHPAVSECAVVGMADSYKGQIPLGMVVLKSGSTISQEELSKELISMVRAQVGAVASFKNVIIVNRLPKTRSGKILRKTLRAIADEKDYQVPSTIEDGSVLGEIEEYMEEFRENR
ncbi:MAG: propionyl-CoA synthetase [Bacteroidetes bacterium]|nr:propionyl-CoA synthetase [Bacteroidota bacterium]MCB0841777.1 propionyl-CoA synthetase [Bacteroidota bacterium]MCB0852653.1 propionyl-CoA synthetase [Bacteroidota bacterium]